MSTVSLPSNLPSVANAKLPQVYEQAREALTNCYRIDECKTWADKAEAIASYAKQADDQMLLDTARRIQGRAVKRCGELLQEFRAHENGKAGRPKQNGVGAHPISQRQAAKEAGLSKQQEKTAVRVARIPGDEFESLVESGAPPTVTALAERGKVSKPKPLVDLKGRDPAEFSKATTAQGAIQRMAILASDTKPAVVARGLLSHEVKPLIKEIGACIRWLTTVERALRSIQ